MSDRLTDAQFEAAGPSDFRVVLGRAHGRWRTGSFAVGAGFVAAIAELADQLNHHPDVDLRYASVTIALSSHDVGGLSERDLELARRISELAAQLGLPDESATVQQVEVAIDVLHGPAVWPFWQAVLGYRVDDPQEQPAPGLGDPWGQGVPVWFQQLDRARPGRGRIHLDVSVAHDVARERVAAALAAGGVLVSDTSAPTFWVLADAEGNEACICTWQGREG